MKKTKAQVRFEQENNANKAFQETQKYGSHKFGLVWLYANMDATTKIGRGEFASENGAFANCEDSITRAVISTSIQAALDNANPIIEGHANTISGMRAILERWIKTVYAIPAVEIREEDYKKFRELIKDSKEIAGLD